jgi:hypothetical protein
MAIPETQDGYTQIYAMLLWAKATGTALNITTSGQVVAQCAHPGVSEILTLN